jgi:hypothetical protein
MKIDKTKLDELKAARPGGLLESAISFTDDDNTLHEVEFICRKPTTADMESYTKSSQKNPLVAKLTSRFLKSVSRQFQRRMFPRCRTSPLFPQFPRRQSRRRTRRFSNKGLMKYRPGLIKSRRTTPLTHWRRNFQ